MKTKWIIFALLFIGLFAVWFFLPVAEWLKTFNGWIDQQGALGWVIFGGVYVAATVLLVPGAILTLAAGLAFGLWAVLLVVPAATAGAALAFLVARYAARGAVKSKFEDSEKFRAIDQAISEDGWKIVGLLRLSPLIPFNLQNYLYGITDIRFWHYVLATFVAIIPGSLMYVYFGAAGKAALTGGGEGGTSTLKWVLFGVGLVATIIVTVLITRKAKSRLKEIGVKGEGELPE